MLEDYFEIQDWLYTVHYSPSSITRSNRQNMITNLHRLIQEVVEVIREVDIKEWKPDPGINTTKVDDELGDCISFFANAVIDYAKIRGLQPGQVMVIVANKMLKKHLSTLDKDWHCGIIKNIHSLLEELKNE